MKTRRMRLSFNKSEFVSRISLGGAGGIIAMPKSIDQLNKMREEFGMFGSSNNMNTFYPGINVANDVMPKPEDFIEVPYRLMSSTTVAGGTWRATDFSAPGVVESSISKMVNKTVYLDHDTEAMNWIGYVKATKFSAGFINNDGTKVPPGMDGVLAIDAKTNPKAARGVLMGTLYSNSVTIDFEYEPSHTFSNYQDFENLVGTYDEKGKMITRVATNILDYYETSLLWLGADPFAKLIDAEGNLVNIDKSAIVEFSKEPKFIQNEYTKNKKLYVSSCFSKKDSIALASNYSFTSLNNSNDNTMDEKVILALKVLLGLAVTDKFTEEHLPQIQKLMLLKDGQEVFIKTEVDKFKSDLIAATTEAEKVSTLTAEFAALKTTFTANEPFITIGKSVIELKRDEVKRLYAITVGNDIDEAVTANFDKADNATLDGFLKQYGGTATAKFTGTCNGCGGQDFTFKSSFVADKTPGKGKEQITTFSVDDFKEKYGNK